MTEVSGISEADLWSLSATQLTETYRLKKASPVEVARSVAQRLKLLNPRLNAFSFFDEEDVLRQAKESEKRWLSSRPLSALDGATVSVKDNIQANNTPTLHGSRGNNREASFLPDSPSVARMREAGAIILGKTTMPEFAHKVTTESPMWGTTLNPWDMTRSPGGSSGGAAAAVAAGIGALALGTDAGGSVRIPSSWSGIFGFKPTFGRVPHYPQGSYAPLSHVGPMSRTVQDAALMMDQISRPDSRDWFSLPPIVAGFQESCLRGVKGFKVAVSINLGMPDLNVDGEIAEAVRSAATALRALGADVREADPPGISKCTEVQMIMWISYCAMLARKYQHVRDLLDPVFLQLADRGESLPKHAFLEATATRAESGREVDEFFSSYDLLLCPVTETLAPLAPPEQGRAPIMPRMASWCNQVGLPAASIPVGIGKAGLPLGVQLVGKRFMDENVLRASYSLEQSRSAFPWPKLAI